MAKRRPWTRRQAQDRHPRTGQKLHELTSAQLQQTLVTDALTGYETPLPWFVAACRRIARLDRISEDEAFLRVRDEVTALGGFLPGAPAGPRSLP